MDVGKKQTGFTIVELLIVVVVIAILAAITIVAYNGIQNRAKSSALQSMVSQTAKKVALAAVNDNDQYPADKTAFKSVTGVNDTANETYDYVASDTRKAYCVSVTNTKGDSFATISSGGSGSGRCVQNVVLNPSAEQNLSGMNASAGNSATVAVTSTQTSPFSGANALRATWTVAPSPSNIGGVWVVSNSATGLNAGGKTYTASGYIRVSWVGANFGLNLVGRNSASGVTSEVYGQSSTIPKDTWTRVSVTWTAPANTDYFEVRIRHSGGSAPVVGSTMDADAFMLTEGTPLYGYGGAETSSWAAKAASGNSISFGPALLQ